MHITVNGERRDMPGPLTIEALLHELRIDPRLVVIEHNRQLIKRPELARAMLQPDDTLEIVRIVGGG